MTTAELEARQEAQRRAIEAATVAAAVAVIHDRIQAVLDRLASMFHLAGSDPQRWLYARLEAERALRRINAVRVRVVIESMLDRAAMVGARTVGQWDPGGIDTRTDPLIADILDTVVADVTAKLAAAASRIERGPLDTKARLDTATHAALAAEKAAARAATDSATRAIDEGTRAVTDALGLSRVWVAEPGACLSCVAMAGSVARPRGLFVPAAPDLAPRLIPWLPGGVTGPPAHTHCRCHTVVAAPGLSEALRRAAAREVARGESDFDSLPDRLAALDALLRRRGGSPGRRGFAA
jgi:hypothetical protein